MAKNQTVWTEAEEQKLTHLWNNGMSVRLIGIELGKTGASIKMYRQRHGDRLGLITRTALGIRKTEHANYSDSFEKAWNGCVPFGHWTITKAWSKQQ